MEIIFLEIGKFLNRFISCETLISHDTDEKENFLSANRDENKSKLPFSRYLSVTACIESSHNALFLKDQFKTTRVVTIEVTENWRNFQNLIGKVMNSKNRLSTGNFLFPSVYESIWKLMTASLIGWPNILPQTFWLSFNVNHNPTLTISSLVLIFHSNFNLTAWNLTKLDCLRLKNTNAMEGRRKTNF